VSYSTLEVKTDFAITSDENGEITSAAATSAVTNVSGQKFSDEQLSLMGTNIGAIQQGGVTRGYGDNTTELLTAVAAKETIFGAANPAKDAPARKDPAINPLQLSGGLGTLDRQHNIQGALGVLSWAGTPSGFDPRSTYDRFTAGKKGAPSGVLDLFMKFYNGIQEDSLYK
jgi:hypothetical protein